MKTLRLKPREKSSIPVEAEIISPNICAGRSLNEVMKLPVYVGNRIEKLVDYFAVDGELAEKHSDQQIIVEGDIPWVKYLGSGMTGGRILVEGSVGMHTGSNMSGGEIEVEGSSSDWTGAEMSGGLIRIKGNAGNLLGAAYRGSSEGMTGGCIVVGGDAGVETASFMRRGMIAILGDVAPFAGAHMNGGEIFAFGHVGPRLGAEMKGNGGVIVCLGEVESMLPTFIHDTTYKPTFMKLYLRQLFNQLHIPEAEKYLESKFKRYRGDLAVGGNGEILVAEEK